MFKKILLLAFISGVLTANAEKKSTIEERLLLIEASIKSLKQELAQKDETISQLRQKLEAESASNKEERKLLTDLLEFPVNEEPQEDSHIHGANCYHPKLKKTSSVNQSKSFQAGVTFNGAIGAANRKDSVLSEYQGGGHDADERGFNFQQAEFSMSGTVDGVGSGYFNAVFLDDDVELEEAFFESRALGDFKLKAGYFLTEFGIVNQQHAHAWYFIDQPIINTRLFGGEGMRDAGLLVRWQTPLPWENELTFGAQKSDGDNVISFRGEGHSHGDEEEEHSDEHFEETIAGRPFAEDPETEGLDDLAWTARWSHSFEPMENNILQTGFSGLYGSNLTGGKTVLYGADFRWISLTEEKDLDWVFQAEIMKREFNADAVDIEESEPLAGDAFSLGSSKVEDWGLYTQFVKYLSSEWSAGLRYEYVSGSGNSFEEDERIRRQDDFDRSDRYRISPALTWQAHEQLKLRLQYNYDDSKAEGKTESIWLGAEFFFGAHPSHRI